MKIDRVDVVKLICSKGIKIATLTDCDTFLKKKYPDLSVRRWSVNTAGKY